MQNGNQSGEHWLSKRISKFREKRDSWKKTHPYYYYPILAILIIAGFIVHHYSEKLLDEISWGWVVTPFFYCSLILFSIFGFALDQNRCKKHQIQMSFEPWILIAVLFGILLIHWIPHFGSNSSAITLRLGASVVEPKTGVRFGFMSPGENMVQACLRISAPGQPETNIFGILPGRSWDFSGQNEYKGKMFNIEANNFNFSKDAKTLDLIVSESTTDAATDHSTNPQSNLTANNASGSAVVNGNGNSVNVENGASDSTVKQILNLKAVELTEKIQAEYPQGCVLIGLENGNVIYDSRLKGIQFKADWDNAKIAIRDGNVYLSIPQITIVSGGLNLTIGMGNQIFPLAENEPVRTRWVNVNGFSLYCEVLDKDRDIFIIGCK